MDGLISEGELRSACQVLFGSHVDPPPEFFSYLQPDGVKAAFRKKARETHPDATVENRLDSTHATCEAFHQVNDAYKLLFSFVTGKNQIRFDRAPRTSRPCAGRHQRDIYHHGSLPHRRLEIGRFLYYCGIIPYHSLIAAVTWQRSQRPPLGRLARNLGILSDASVQLILRSRTYTGHFGDKAIQHGLLTRSQVSMLLLHQRSRQQKLGKYFIDSGYLTESEMELAVQEMRRHNAKMPFHY